MFLMLLHSVIPGPRPRSKQIPIITNYGFSKKNSVCIMIYLDDAQIQFTETNIYQLAYAEIGRSEYTRGRHCRHVPFSNIVILAAFWHVMFRVKIQKAYEFYLHYLHDAIIYKKKFKFLLICLAETTIFMAFEFFLEFID